MAEPVDNLRYGMEDLAWAAHSQPSTEMALCSIAVSLKRIADSLSLVVDEGQHGYIFPAVRVRNQS